ncbi:hypothetical protein [Rhizobium favelukesii]|uniref:Uncharacterized protein n=1 Tax=Rhizobium favelukesii TaxID=348824 RepID=W6RFD5_9HYPH|nr:hypothetical protein [Rhizobium favelukesii]MCS0459295.1 hypothetical protein [Rhizobium favelukesii]CDM57403.1 putative predicted protein [Rhizobium favelukesii]
MKDSFWVYGGVPPFSRFSLGWHQAEVEAGRKHATVRLKTKRKVVKLKLPQWDELVTKGGVKHV